MKTIILLMLVGFLNYYYSPASTLHGQPGPTDVPYIINIKKNINNIKSINLSDIGKELNYIPLETISESLINQIDHLAISDSFIFVSERQKLLQFDKNGKFIRQIGSRGRGPEEYLAVMDFCLDNQCKEIYILSFYQHLVFGFDGQFKRSFNLPIRPFQIIFKDQNSLMYHLPNGPNPKKADSNSWVITDKQGKIKQTFKNYLIRVNQPGIIVGVTPLYNFNNTVHFMEFGIDTLYYLLDIQKKPYAIFNLGNLKMDPDPLYNPATNKKDGEKLFGTFWINSIYENTDFLFVKLFRGLSDSSMCILCNKKTADVTILKDNAFKNDLDGGIMFWPKLIINDNILIDYIDAFNLLKIVKKLQSEAKTKRNKNMPTKLLNLSKKLTETSNPVLVILK